MKVHFRNYLIVWIVGSIQILLDCVWPFELRFYWKNESSSFSDDQDMKLNEVIYYVWSGDRVEARSTLWESGIVQKTRLRCRNWLIIEYPINFANEIAKLLDNFVIYNPFCLIFSDQMEHVIIPSLKKIGVQHVQSQQYRCFNIEWAWFKIFEFSKFDDAILEQVGTICHLQSNNPLI